MANGAANKPFILVLAGVNGAGKSSVGGKMLSQQGLDCFNADTFARQLIAEYPLTQDEASSIAWHQNCSLLEEAITRETNYVFETTLGANTIRDLLIKASASHRIVMLFCGLNSPDMHIARVKLRVTHGGHSINENKIRERWVSSRSNLIRLLPYLTDLQVFDNSAEAAPNNPIPDPMLVLEITNGEIVFPTLNDARALAATPEWAQAIVQAAIERQR